MPPPQISLSALPGIPLVEPGADLAALILEGLGRAEITLENDDILVLASKIVSKAEGRTVDLGTVKPGPVAEELARVTGKDPRELELMVQESSEVVRVRPGLVILRHRLGFVSANAGLDHSNVPGGAERVLLLPENPDRTAGELRSRFLSLTGAHVGVIIADSHGRPHRMGTIGIAIGAAGLPALEDWRGRPDLFGYVLQHTEIGLADMVASAATLLLGQAREGTPVVHVRGVSYSSRDGRASELVRPKEMDLFL